MRYNFSGHPVSEIQYAPFIGVEFPSDVDGLTELIRDTLIDLPQRDEILAGAIPEVILPGLSNATAILLAEWHGQFGNFPSIRWAVRIDTGYQYPDDAKADLNKIRDQARTTR